MDLVKQYTVGLSVNLLFEVVIRNLFWMSQVYQSVVVLPQCCNLDLVQSCSAVHVCTRTTVDIN